MDISKIKKNRLKKGTCDLKEDSTICGESPCQRIKTYDCIFVLTVGRNCIETIYIPDLEVFYEPENNENIIDWKIIEEKK